MAALLLFGFIASLTDKKSPSTSQKEPEKAVKTHKKQRSPNAPDSKLVEAFRPLCEEYIRERWAGRYILYDQGRYKWWITNIKKLKDCTTTNCYLVDLKIRFTNHVGVSEEYYGSLGIGEADGKHRITTKLAWCVLMDGQKLCSQ